MNALVRARPGEMKCVVVDPPVPMDDEVVVQVMDAGICGSDIHRFFDQDNRWNSIILGHEFAGVVVESGPAAKQDLVGRRVAVAPLVPCHRCEHCQRGWYSQCAHYSFIGSRRNGAFAEYVAVPQRNLVFLPDSLSTRRAALIEPITVVLHPLMMLPQSPGSTETAVVMGLGPIGLLAVQVFRWMGVPNILACDVVSSRIELALQTGASHGIDVSTTAIEEVAEPLGGAQIVFEASGSAGGQNAAIRAASSRGRVLLVGTSPAAATIEPGLLERVSRKEISITGSWMNYSPPWPGPEWTTAVRLLVSNAIDDTLLVTHRFPLDRGNEAFAIIAERSEPFVKILISTQDGES